MSILDENYDDHGEIRTDLLRDVRDRALAAPEDPIWTRIAAALTAPAPSDWVAAREDWRAYTQDIWSDPRTRKWMRQRRDLIQMDERTPAQDRLLRALGEMMETLPTGDSPETVQTQDIIRRAAFHLHRGRSTPAPNA